MFHPLAKKTILELERRSGSESIPLHIERLLLCLLCRIYCAPDEDGFSTCFGKSNQGVERWMELSSDFLDPVILLVSTLVFAPLIRRLLSRT